MTSSHSSSPPHLITSASHSLTKSCPTPRRLDPSHTARLDMYARASPAALVPPAARALSFAASSVAAVRLSCRWLSWLWPSCRLYLTTSPSGRGGRAKLLRPTNLAVMYGRYPYYRLWHPDRPHPSSPHIIPSDPTPDDLFTVSNIDAPTSTKPCTNPAASCHARAMIAARLSARQQPPVGTRECMHETHLSNKDGAFVRVTACPCLLIVIQPAGEVSRNIGLHHFSLHPCPGPMLRLVLPVECLPPKRDARNSTLGSRIISWSPKSIGRHLHECVGQSTNLACVGGTGISTPDLDVRAHCTECDPTASCCARPPSTQYQHDSGNEVSSQQLRAHN